MNFFDDAVSSHLAWKDRLRATVEERRAAPDTLTDDHDCDLGRWIFGVGAEFSHLDSYNQLRESHARFHRCAAAVIAAVERGDWEEAEELLDAGGEFAESSAETIVAIGALRTDIESARYGDPE